MKKASLKFAMVCSAGAIIALALPATAAPNRTFEQAIDICTKRAVQFGNSTYGREADFPAPNQVQDRYRACVFANAGQYPTSKVEYRKTIFSLNGLLR